MTFVIEINFKIEILLLFAILCLYLPARSVTTDVCAYTYLSGKPSRSIFSKLNSYSRAFCSLFSFSFFVFIANCKMCVSNFEMLLIFFSIKRYGVYVSFKLKQKILIKLDIFNIYHLKNSWIYYSLILEYFFQFIEF